MRDLEELASYKQTMIIPPFLALQMQAKAASQGVFAKEPIKSIDFYVVDGLKIIASNGIGWDHLSISPLKKGMIPTWEEMCRVKELFFLDNETAIQYHPAMTRHVSEHHYTLHLWRLQNTVFPLPLVVDPNAATPPTTQITNGINDLSGMEESRLPSADNDRYNGLFRIDRNGSELYVQTSTRLNAGWHQVSVFCSSGTPLWEDMHHVRKMFIDSSATGIQIHPAKNLERKLAANTLEIWIPTTQSIPAPDPRQVGGLSTPVK